jgi:hypothetical protein
VRCKVESAWCASRACLTGERCRNSLSKHNILEVVVQKHRHEEIGNLGKRITSLLTVLSSGADKGGKKWACHSTSRHEES